MKAYSKQSSVSSSGTRSKSLAPTVEEGDVGNSQRVSMLREEGGLCEESLSSMGLFDAAVDWVEDLVLGPEATAQPNGTISLRGGGIIGPFNGVIIGDKPRAEIIADRINAANGSFGPVAVDADGSGGCKVTTGACPLFSVQKSDAYAAGFVEPRLLAWQWATEVTGEVAPKELAAGLSNEENRALAAFRAESSVVRADADGSVVAAGIRLGPFIGDINGMSRATIIAQRLGEEGSSSFRGAYAEGNAVKVGSTSFYLTAADASAQGAMTPELAAAAQAERLVGTWTQGVNESEPGRVVLPPNLSEAALYEFARGVAEGPGRIQVPDGPNQVTVVAIRSVHYDTGVYAPAGEAEDDLVIPMLMDGKGDRHALRLQAVMDPGSFVNPVQVGDATEDYEYKGYTTGNDYLKGTTYFRPMNDGIEAKDVSKPKEIDQVPTAETQQKATLVHFGKNNDYSEGCTVVTDKDASYTDAVAFENQRLDLASESDRSLSASELATRVEQARASGASQADIVRLTSLLDVRQSEEAVAARGSGREYDSLKLLGAPNFKAFISFVYRDPDLQFRYVAVDGSKIPSLQLGQPGKNDQSIT